MTETVFSKIITREITADIVYEDEAVLAFLDINPVNFGHTLVIPKKYYKNIFDMPREEFSYLMGIVHMLAPVIKKAVEAGGIHIGMNNEAPAGQVVFHAHVHIVPRSEGDGYAHWKRAQPIPINEHAVAGERIREVLTSK